ncbi:hypothetical protein ABPG72_013509 [Tetrahymena utriculariae]
MDSQVVILFNSYFTQIIKQQELSEILLIRKNTPIFTKLYHNNFIHNLSLAQADLSSEEGQEEAVKDCRYVLHIASPFNYEAKTPQEIINPDVLGTRYVLNACVKHSQTIKKVVLNSSGKAIFEGNTHRVYFDETIWQNYENSGYYGQSKYFAEKEAWKISEENKDKLNLSTINPTLILDLLSQNTFQQVKGLNKLNQNIQFIIYLFYLIKNQVC